MDSVKNGKPFRALVSGNVTREVQYVAGTKVGMLIFPETGRQVSHLLLLAGPHSKFFQQP